MTATAKFVWFEYVSKQGDKAQGFFGELFNWSTQAVPMPEIGDYKMIAVGDRTIGGYLPTPTGAPEQAHWLSHLGVADAAASAAKVKAAGGKVLKEATKIGEFGTMAIVSDPQGGVFALWQPAKGDDEAPAPTTGTFCWNELASSDPKASLAFYQAIGGFEVETMEMPGMGSYHVLKSGGQPRAGIMKQSMPGQPHAWLPYVSVASADVTTERAKKLGANVVVPPTDIPNVGRFAIFLDPQGAALGILQP
ncbi:MAG TPA: VOC family protein [Kofleriaceae bacterium]|nr:VOC family protein [Kofleriaceae bacterium]